MGCHPQILPGCLPVALLDSSRCRIQIGYRMSRVNLYTRFYYLIKFPQFIFIAQRHHIQLA